MNNFSPKRKGKILVTGGAGYIGSHVIAELVEAGYAPIVVDNLSNSSIEVIYRLEELTQRSIPFYQVDCKNAHGLQSIIDREGSIDGVIHLAAYKAVSESVERPLTYYQNNLEGLMTLLQVMQDRGVDKMVFSSTCAVYGNNVNFPVDEGAAISIPESPYGRTKQVGERIINDQVNANIGLKAVSLRYFNPIGAHPSGLIGEWPMKKQENLIPFLARAAFGLVEGITVHGNDYPTPDGTCIRDYVHVMDIASAHVKALNWLKQSESNNLYDCFNLGTGAGASVLEMISTFEKVSGEKLTVKIGPRRKGDIPEMYANPEKAAKVLGWSANRTISQALSDAWEWQTIVADAHDKHYPLQAVGK